jgi:Flp pilus assembly protein TadD
MSPSGKLRKRMSALLPSRYLCAKDPAGMARSVFDWLGHMLHGGSNRSLAQGSLPEERSDSKPTLLVASELFQRGLEAYAAGQFDEAVRSLEIALEKEHDLAEAHYYTGLAQHQLGCYEDASDAYALALCFGFDSAKAHFALALSQQQQSMTHLALASVQQAIQAGYAGAGAYNLQGVLLLEKGDVAGAIASFQNAVRAEPQHAVAHSNLGYLLYRDCGDYEAGAAQLECALELDPDNLDVQRNYSMMLSHCGDVERALGLCTRILALRPDMHEVRLNRALVLLKLGRFESGWKDYEARKKVRCNYVPRELDWPEWHGEPLVGTTVLVHGEQGLGDEIMFASCFPELIDAARHCVIECAPRLERLFARSFPRATVFAGEQDDPVPRWLAAAPKIDFQVPAGSLPLHFRRHTGAFPIHAGYLRAEPSRVLYWQNRLQSLGPSLKVGVSWRGGMRSTGASLRSITLSRWLPILTTPRVHFVSLQYGDTEKEREDLLHENGIVLHNWHEALDDLDEQAALTTALDLVISVAATAIHLAGGVGKPVWILVPSVPEWRYQASGTSMPWYPAATLFRQNGNDWDSVIADVAGRLSELHSKSEHGIAR